MIAIPRPAIAARLPWPYIALGGAVLIAALYLGDRLTWLAPLLYYSVIGLPVLGLLMILPTALALGCLAYVLQRLLPRPLVVALTLTPLLGWSTFYAPLAQSRILAVAAGDGGTLPHFDRRDILAIIDRTSPRHPSKSFCTASCIALLQSGAIPAIFLPRHVSSGGAQIHGVIYRPAHWGRTCDRELSAQGVRPLCVSEAPATLWDVTHVLETYTLPATAMPGELGLHGGEQMRLTHRYSGDVLLQRTSLSARVPSRMPLFGDLALWAESPSVIPRMTTTLVERLWKHPPLIDMVRASVDRRAGGLE